MSHGRLQRKWLDGHWAAAQTLRAGRDRFQQEPTLARIGGQIEGKASLAKLQAANAVLETIRANISNPGRVPAAEHEQQMLAPSAHLSMLISK